MCEHFQITFIEIKCCCKLLRFCRSHYFTLSRFSTWRICSREQAKSECDWVVMSSVFVASQSSCFFLCSREQIRLVENRSGFKRSLVVFLDTNPPGIEFTGDLPSFSKKQITFTWKSDEDSQFECRMGNTPNYNLCGNGMTGNTTLQNLPEGNHTFYVRARDKLDNLGKPISHSWTVGEFRLFCLAFILPQAYS